MHLRFCRGIQPPCPIRPLSINHPDALSTLTDDDQTAWHLRYCPQEGLEMRARATLARVEGDLRGAGAEVTIHALWVALADRAGQDGEPDVKAAAALAGMAMGLRAG